MTTEPTRRSFLLAAGTVVAGSVARGYPANETLNVGLIGTGGRCRHLMQSLAKIANVRITAVCDVWDAALAEGSKLADPKAFATKQYQELLDRKDVDAVLIGSPDHWHVPMTVAACEAGKDVYVEKPLTHDLAEGKAVIEAQNEVEADRAGRHAAAEHAAHRQGAASSSRPGRIGKVLKVHMTWNRNTRPGPPVPARRRPEVGGLEGVPRQRPGAAVRRVPLPELALVLGLRRRHLHRPDGPLDRRRPLGPRPRPPEKARQHRRALRGQGRVGDAGHGADAPDATRAACRCTSRGRSATPATGR